MAAIETESQGELRQLSGVLFIKDHIKREWRLYDKRGNNHWYRTSLSNETIQSLHPFLSNYRGGDETKILIHPLVILLPVCSPCQTAEKEHATHRRSWLGHPETVGVWANQVSEPAWTAKCSSGFRTHGLSLQHCECLSEQDAGHNVSVCLATAIHSERRKTPHYQKPT